MFPTEYHELNLHRAHLRLQGKLDGLKARLTTLEAPLPDLAAQAQRAQGEKVERFWKFSQAEQEEHPALSAAEARQRVLKQHPEFRLIYPRILD